MTKKLVPTWNKKPTTNIQDAERLLKKAHQYMDIQDFKNALKYADMVLKQNAQSISALLVKGSALTHLIHIEEAFDCYQAILTIDPNHTGAKKSIAILHLATGIGDTNTVDVESALQANSHDHRMHFLYGKDKLEHGDIEGALLAFSRAYTINPADIQYAHKYLTLLFQHGDFAKALYESDRMLRKHPKDLLILEIKGRSLIELGKHEEGIAIFDTLIRQDSDPVRSHFAKACVFFKLKRFHEAEQAIMAIPASYHSQPDVTLIYGQTLYSLKKYEEASRIIREALYLNKDNPEVLDLYTKILIDKGEVEEALQTLRLIESIQGLSSNQLILKISLLIQTERDCEAEENIVDFADKSNYPEKLYNIGLDAYKQGDTAVAQLCTEEYTSRYPEDVDGWVLLGLINKEIDDFDETDFAFSNALTIDPNHLTALYHYIDYLTDYDEYEKAQLLNDHYIELNRNCSSLIMKGWILGQLEEFNEAYDIFLKLSLEFPEEEVVWFDLGWISSELGRTHEAQAAYLKSIEVNPTYGDAWADLGALYLSEGQIPEAIETLRTAFRLLNDDSDCLEDYAKALFAGGKYEEAIVAYKEYVELRPGNVEGWFALADSCFEAGHYEEAMEATVQGLKLEPTSKQGERLKAKIEFRLHQNKN
jgi:tetratricopeptide (TPR) repeat protein